MFHHSDRSRLHNIGRARFNHISRSISQYSDRSRLHHSGRLMFHHIGRSSSHHSDRSRLQHIGKSLHHSGMSMFLHQLVSAITIEMIDGSKI